ncbi:MAG: M48 family metalloprotease [Candidatus Rhabdochlamydia sp.]
MSYAITNYLGSNLRINWDMASVVPIAKPNESITTKIVNFLFPKNELTGRRTFKVIPSFLVNAEGRLNYELYCPFYKISKDPELNELVRSVFDRLVRQINKDCPSTKNLSWEVRITKNPTPNAFCFPGGKTMITTGCIEMLKGRINHEISHEDLITAILAHEIVHAVAEHQSSKKHLNLLRKPIEVAIIYAILSLANPIPSIQLLIKKSLLTCLNQLEKITNKCFHKCLCEWFGKYNWLGKCLKMYDIKHLACFHKELSKYLGKYIEKSGNIYLRACLKSFQE